MSDLITPILSRQQQIEQRRENENKKKLRKLIRLKEENMKMMEILEKQFNEMNPY